MRALALLPLLCFGCAQYTEVVVRIDNAGLVVPTDVATLNITVTNPVDDTGPGPTSYESQPLKLCAPGETRGCFALPISLTLTPGPTKPDAKVRVQVTARTESGTIISDDAATFYFVKHEHQDLSFFLSRSCAGTRCAERGLACGMLGVCAAAVPLPPAEELDLARPPDPPKGTIALVGSESVTGDRLARLVTQPGDLLVLFAFSLAIDPMWEPVVSDSFLNQRVHWVTAEDVADPQTYYPVYVSATSPLYLLQYRGVRAYRGAASGNAETTFTLPPGSPLTTSASEIVVGAVSQSSLNHCTSTSPAAQLLFSANYIQPFELRPATEGATLTCETDGPAPGVSFVSMILTP